MTDGTSQPSSPPPQKSAWFKHEKSTSSRLQTCGNMGDQWPTTLLPCFLACWSSVSLALASVSQESELALLDKPSSARHISKQAQDEVRSTILKEAVGVAIRQICTLPCRPSDDATRTSQISTRRSGKGWSHPLFGVGASELLRPGSPPIPNEWEGLVLASRRPWTGNCTGTCTLNEVCALA